MANFMASVHVLLRPGIADPQGQTIERALPALGYEGVSEVRVGKVIEFNLEATDETEAASKIGGMCEGLLANPVIESYTWDLTSVSVDAARGGT